jgi:hypothetical protein
MADGLIFSQAAMTVNSRAGPISELGTEGAGGPPQARFLFRALRTSSQSMTVPPASR